MDPFGYFEITSNSKIISKESPQDTKTSLENCYNRFKGYVKENEFNLAIFEIANLTDALVGCEGIFLDNDFYNSCVLSARCLIRLLQRDSKMNFNIKLEEFNSNFNGLIGKI